jgi:hypothetical protein
MTELIDNFIKKQHRNLPELDDDALIADYHSCKSVKTRLLKIKTVLLEYGMTHTASTQIARKLLEVPPGTKSHVRGSKFNDIIANEVKRKAGGLDFQREKKHSFFHEIPDWIVTKGRKTLVGYNQVSLFGGGHQLNRASKYILDDTFHAKLSKNNIKMVCIVRDVPHVGKGKSFHILSTGIVKKRLYCIGGIGALLNEYFCS